MNKSLNSPALPVPHFTQPDRRERLLAVSPALEPIFRAQAEQRHMPGVAYGVVVDGELIFTHSFGVANVASQAAVDADTVFRIASMTKSFAAAAILQLRDAGKLRLDEPVATYVPELASLAYPTADAPLITVHHLLTMSAGWPQDDPWGDRQLYQSDAAMRDSYAAGVAWSNPPGMTFEYSNYGYMLLGRVISNVAGLSAIDYITQQILQPLGMNATVWQASQVPTERLALGYSWLDTAWQAEPLLPSGGDVATFAGIFTSVRDLARWVALFQAAWPARDAAEIDPLRRSSLREMQQSWRTGTPTVSVPALGALPELKAGGYGYGLSMQHNGRWESVGHGGGLPGFGSHMRWSPTHGVGIVALANVTYANVSAACVQGLACLITTSQVQPRTPQIAPALAAARQGVLQLLAAWDAALADALFADNFFLDLDRAHWQRELAQLRQQHGSLQADGPFVVENWLRGAWRMAGKRGWCQVAITLSPTVPPRIQEMEITSTLPPSAALQSAAAGLVALIARPTRRGLAGLCAASGVEQAALWEQVRLANILCGPGTLGDVTGGDGTSWASFQLVGSKGNADVRLKVNQRGKLVEANFQLMPAV